MIRPYRESDESAVVALWREVFPDAPAWNAPEQDIRRKLDVQRELFLVAMRGADLLGTAMAGFDGHRGWVYYVAVRPGQRRRGIGRALMHRVERDLAALGCGKLNLQVRASNPRVRLQPPVPGDRDRYLAAVRSSRKLLRPWIFLDESIDGWIALMAGLEREDQQSFFVRRRDSGELAGVFNLSQITRGVLQSAYLGFYALLPHAGRGLMSEGLGLLLRHVFGPLGLHRVEANIQPNNVRSIALVRRCGFTLEGFSPRYLKIGGRWRDHERWAILSDAWRERRRR